MDEASVERLCAAIATYAVEHDSFLTKTKLLKLLYLFDVEYFRLHRKIFTDFSWKFFHLGPWAREFDPTLQGIIASDVLRETFGKYDTPFLEPSQKVDLGKVFRELKDESALRGVLKTWGGAPTNEILDFAYFKTEPMAHAIRNEPLDFSVIPSDPPPMYKRTSSGATSKEIAALRERFTAMRAQSGTEKPMRSIARPQYDEAFRLAMSTLDTDDDY